MSEALVLIKAVVANDTALVLQMLTAGVSPSIIHEPEPVVRRWYDPKPTGFADGQNTPLHAAIEFEQRGMIRLLVEAGADPNQVVEGWNHWTPLLHAMDCELQAAFAQNQPLCADMTSLLIELGADVNSVHGPLTPLAAAMEWQHDVAEELLRAAGACLMV